MIWCDKIPAVMASFRIELHSKDDDGIKALRAALKVLLRRYGLRAVSIEECSAVVAEPK